MSLNISLNDNFCVKSAPLEAFRKNMNIFALSLFQILLKLEIID